MDAALIGAGAVTADGLGVAAIWQGLLSGRSGIGPMPATLAEYARCAAAAVVEVALEDGERPQAQRLSRVNWSKPGQPSKRARILGQQEFFSKPGQPSKRARILGQPSATGTVAKDRDSRKIRTAIKVLARRRNRDGHHAGHPSVPIPIFCPKY